MSKFGSRDVKVWRLGARIIDRTFLRSTLRLIQLSVLHHISTFNILLNEFVYNDFIEFLILINFNDYKYFITFKNDFIYYFKIYYIRYKSEIFVIFLRFKPYLKSHDYRIYRIRFDDENEYIINIFFEYLVQSKIK